MDPMLSIPLVFLRGSGFTCSFGILPALLIGIFYTFSRPTSFFRRVLGVDIVFSSGKGGIINRGKI